MIRLYGPAVGHGSLARVTAGMGRALLDRRKLSGWVPLDSYDDEEVYSGADAPIGVLTAANALPFVENFGWHKQVYVLLPPNSTWVPDQVLRQIAKSKAVLIAPTTWAKQTLINAAFRANADIRTSLWHHGVTSAFRPSESASRDALMAYQTGHFSAVHLASEATERKGTKKLVAAWCQAFDAKKLPSQATLRLVVDGPKRSFDTFLAELPVTDAARGSVVWTERRPDLSPDAARAYYQARHVVIQPSRGEGFGLIPLEARASGVPVVMTACTGHSDHVGAADGKGVVTVPTSGLEPIDDGPDGKAPDFRTEDLVSAIVEAYETWPKLSESANEAAPRIGEEWSWTKVTREWFAREGIE